MSLLTVIAGASLTIAACLTCGLLLFQSLRIRLDRQQVWPLAFLTGASLYSMWVFVLLAVHAGYRAVFWVSSVAVVGWCLRTRAFLQPPSSFDPVPRLWLLAGAACAAPFALLYTLHAMAPEVSPDGSYYHLGVVARYVRQHGFGRVTDNMYANLPMGIEMLFVNAFAIGRHSAAACVHLAFLPALAMAILQFARALGNPRAGVCAALLVFLSPIFGISASSAYVDVGMAAVAFGCFCFLEIWAVEREPRLLIPAGLLAGFAYACKATGFPILLYALGFVAWKLRGSRGRTRSLGIVGICASVMIGPWLIKNAIVLGNPFSPFLNELFPNPHVRISYMESFSAYLRTYDLPNLPLQLPAEVALRGGVLQGLLGPVFLLAPVALLSFYSSPIRRLWAAAVLMLLPYPANIGTRFVLGAVPFLAAALGLSLSRWPGLATAVLIFHSFASWPAVVSLYADPYAWRLENWKWRQALRIESEDSYLRRTIGTYRLAKLIEQTVPPDGRVLMTGGVALAYCNRDVFGVNEAGWNNTLGEMWFTPALVELSPSRVLRFSFPIRRVTGIRIVQQAHSNQIWSAAEVRVGGQYGEIPRDTRWRISANPNPWDVQLAFDNSPVTRWKAWERSRPDMFIQASFGSQQEVSTVEILAAPEQEQLKFALQVETPDGWIQIRHRPEIKAADRVPQPRRAAVQALRRFGVTHLLVQDSHVISEDMYRNTASWGLSLLGADADAKLYKLE